MKGTVLFVDDERNLLQGLRRSLHSKRRDWTMHFACGSDEAIELLETVQIDAIVSDMRMPSMNGATLLTHVQATQPSAIRFILSGQSERDAIFAAVGVSHQFFSKPCDIELLVKTIDNLLDRRAKLSTDTIGMVSALQRLASSADAISAIADALDGGSDDELASAVSNDPSATLKLLQLTNSTYFGHATKVTSSTKALGLLGRGLVSELMEQDLLTGSLMNAAGELPSLPGEVMALTGLDDLSDDARSVNLDDTAHVEELLSRAYAHLQAVGGASGSSTPATAPEEAFFYLLSLWGIPTPNAPPDDEKERVNS